MFLKMKLLPISDRGWIQIETTKDLLLILSGEEMTTTVRRERKKVGKLHSSSWVLIFRAIRRIKIPKLRFKKI